MPDRNIAVDDAGRRLDRILRSAFPNVPPGAIAAAIRKGRVRLDGVRCAGNTRVTQGQTLSYPQWRDTGEVTRRRPHGLPSGKSAPSGVRCGARLESDGFVVADRRIPILDRTEHWIAINKPAGMPSYGTGGIDSDLRTLAAQEGWWRESLSFRPGPVHRLDFATSGVQLFSLSADGARILTEKFRRRRTYKLYLALASGTPPESQTIERRLAYDRSTRTALVERDGTDTVGFRSARTRVIPVAGAPDGSGNLLLAIPESGRTHQVRAHLAAIGHPLPGDRKYGGPGWAEIGIPRGYAPAGVAGELFLLHALALVVEGDGPVIGDAIFLSAPLPPEARKIVHRIFGDPADLATNIGDFLARSCTMCPPDATILL